MGIAIFFGSFCGVWVGLSIFFLEVMSLDQELSCVKFWFYIDTT
jgi:hypothetical protein